MLDFAGPGLKAMMNKKMAGMLQNAPFKFARDNGLAYFEDLGWAPSRWKRYLLPPTGSAGCRYGCAR